VKLPNHLLDVLHGRATELQDRPALWTRGKHHFQPTSWRQLAQKVRQQTLGLGKLGLKRGDRVAVPEVAREEAWVARLAVLALGGQVVSVTGNPAEAPWLAKARLKAAFGLAGSPVPAPVTISLDDPSEGPSYVSLLRNAQAKDDSQYWNAIQKLKTDDPAMWIWDGGAEGVPLSHHNLVWTSWKRALAGKFNEERSVLSDFGDAAHSVHHFWTLLTGSEISFIPVGASWVDSLREIRPTVLLASAPAWDELRAELERLLSRLKGFGSWPVSHARSLFRDHQRRIEAKERIPISVTAQEEAGRRFVMPLRVRLGLDRLRVAQSVGEPLPRETLDLFSSVDVLIAEGYGTAATSQLVTLNVPGATRLGSRGRPLFGVELRVDEKRGLWVRGENVASKKAGKDGWFKLPKSGHLDEDGYLWLDAR